MVALIDVFLKAEGDLFFIAVPPKRRRFSNEKPSLFIEVAGHSSVVLFNKVWRKCPNNGINLTQRAMFRNS
jgi:hypothetical protein